MKKIKKIFSVLLTLAMVLGMSMTSFAEEATVPTENDAKDVTVSNVERGATVNAYQIIDAYYDVKGNGFVKYVWSDGRAEADKDVKFDTDGNVVGLTSDYITNLAKNVSGLGTPVTATAGEGNTATLNLKVGTWLILVTPPTSDAAKVYNPMVASVYYTEWIRNQ